MQGNPPVKLHCTQELLPAAFVLCLFGLVEGAAGIERRKEEERGLRPPGKCVLSDSLATAGRVTHSFSLKLRVKALVTALIAPTLSHSGTSYPGYMCTCLSLKKQYPG